MLSIAHPRCAVGRFRSPEARRRRWGYRVRRLGVTGAVLGAAWLALPLLVPLPDSLTAPLPGSPALLDRHGEVLDDFPRGDLFRHHPATLGEIPADLVAATLVAEDRRFFRHRGIDYLAVARAVRDSWKQRRIVSGASTITQQVVKISSPPTPRNLLTKLREGLAARHLEFRRSKDEILAAYLNRLDYGHHRQGCREAAARYFDKSLADLSLAECALLAGLPQAPSRLNPFRHPERALARRDWILDRLESAWDYDPARIAAARAEPLRLRSPGASSPVPHLAMRIRTSAPRHHDLQVSIDGRLQERVNEIVRTELLRLRGMNVQHAAVVVLDNATGEILALTGSGDFDDPRGGQIDGTTALRSAGSTLKPFTYLLAIERNRLHPASIVADIPTAWRTEEGLDAPTNFDHRYYGPVTLRHALANSLNVAAMRTLNEVGGPVPLHALLGQFGIAHLDRPAVEYGLGLTIGNAEVRLLDLANAFATLARLGEYRPVTFRPGAPPAAGRRVAGPEAAYLIADILSDNGARSAAFGRASALRLPFRCAVKTGTSSDFRDNWCLGFTAGFTVGVWTGNFDNSPMRGISGVSGAGPIFHHTMRAVHAARPATWMDRPAGVMPVVVDTRTGHRILRPPDPLPAHAARDLCLASNPPPPASAADYDAEGRALLDARYRAWLESGDTLRRRGFALAPDLPLALEPRILVPPPGATYLLDPELPSGGDRLVLRTNLPSHLRWSSPTLRIDGDVARLTPGTHRITLHDDRSGRSRQRAIVVDSL